MTDNATKRRLIFDVIIGSVFSAGLYFFIFEEDLPKYAKAAIYFGGLFIFSILKFTWREMKGKELVGTAAVYSMLISGFGSIIWVIFTMFLDYSLKCPKGQFISNPDGTSSRSIPHAHRRRFECEPCRNPHLSYGDEEL